MVVVIEESHSWLKVMVSENDLRAYDSETSHLSGENLDNIILLCKTIYSHVKSAIKLYAFDSKIDFTDIDLTEFENVENSYETMQKIIDTNLKWSETHCEQIWLVKAGRNINVYYSTHNYLVHDFFLICLLYSLNPVCVDYVLYDLDRKIFEIIEHLYLKYKIANDPTYITSDNKYILKTVMQTFPEVFCEFYSLSIIDSPLSLDVLCCMDLSQINSAILCPLFPMVASKQLFKYKRNIVPQLLWIAVQLDEYKNINNINITDKWKQLRTSIITSKVPEEHKLVYCLKWELIKNNKKPVGFWSQCRSICLYLLDERYIADEDWIKTRDEIERFALIF